MYNDQYIPAVYGDDTDNWMHKDFSLPFIPWKWQPWCWIPRKWTFIGLPMTPKKVIGNMVESPVLMRPEYPIAPDCVTYQDEYGNTAIDTMHSNGGIGQWAVLNAYFKFVGRRIPCYLTATWSLFGRKQHFNGSPLAPLAPVIAATLVYFGLPWYYWFGLIPFIVGIKPDVNYKDMGWWLEASLNV